MGAGRKIWNVWLKPNIMIGDRPSYRDSSDKLIDFISKAPPDDQGYTFYNPYTGVFIMWGEEIFFTLLGQQDFVESVRFHRETRIGEFDED